MDLLVEYKRTKDTRELRKQKNNAEDGWREPQLLAEEGTHDGNDCNTMPVRGNQTGSTKPQTSTGASCVEHSSDEEEIGISVLGLVS